MRIGGLLVSMIALSMAGTATAAAPHKAQKATAKPPAAAGSDTKATGLKSPPDFGAMLAFVDKLFPPQPDPDPARLALARTSVGAMWPDGAYGKMMTGFMGGMIDRVMQLKESDLPVAVKDKKGATATDAGKDVSLHDQIAAKDPYFDQRMAAIRDVMTEEVGKISAIIDPRMREGLARAMARRFDAQQLTDINGFFATPSGRAFGSQYMQLWMDADTIRSIFSSMPEMMKLMPEMMQKIKAATDKFPSPKKASDAPAKS